MYEFALQHINKDYDKFEFKFGKYVRNYSYSGDSCLIEILIEKRTSKLMGINSFYSTIDKIQFEDYQRRSRNKKSCLRRTEEHELLEFSDEFSESEWV